jgi:hypothetical protein
MLQKNHIRFLYMAEKPCPGSSRVRYHVLRKQHAHKIVTTYKLSTICSIALCKSPFPLHGGRQNLCFDTNGQSTLHTRWAIDRNDAQKKTLTRLAGRIEPKSEDITGAYIATTIHKIPFFLKRRRRSSLNTSKGKWSRFLPVSLSPEYRRRGCNGGDTKTHYDFTVYCSKMH